MPHSFSLSLSLSLSLFLFLSPSLSLYLFLSFPLFFSLTLSLSCVERFTEIFLSISHISLSTVFFFSLSRSLLSSSLPSFLSLYIFLFPLLCYLFLLIECKIKYTLIYFSNRLSIYLCTFSYISLSLYLYPIIYRFINLISEFHYLLCVGEGLCDTRLLSDHPLDTYYFQIIFLSYSSAFTFSRLSMSFSLYVCPTTSLYIIFSKFLYLLSNVPSSLFVHQMLIIY